MSRTGPAAVRLRKDKVVRRVVRDLEIAFAGAVPTGKALIFTLGAPIKVPEQLITALIQVGMDLLEKGGTESERVQTILSNRVRLGLVDYRGRKKSRVFGLVFTGGPQSIALAKTLLED